MNTYNYCILISYHFIIVNHCFHINNKTTQHSGLTYIRSHSHNNFDTFMVTSYLLK